MINNTNHPCYGLDCKECDTCIFDVDLFKEDKMKNTCNDCSSLVRNYIGENRLQFNACCDRCIINYVSYSRPRNIQYKVGNMLDIIRPTWCPKERGVTKEYKSYTEVNSMASTPTTTPPALPAATPSKKFLTYSEKREMLMKLPKRTEWEDINEGDVYVIPKIMSQSRKVIRVVVKTDSCVRYLDIDEFGKESTVCSSMYKSDIDSVFITKLHKY